MNYISGYMDMLVCTNKKVKVVNDDGNIKRLVLIIGCNSYNPQMYVLTDSIISVHNVNESCTQGL